jgi:L-seryl-tRNA(Ser) seleniumtransferase
MNPALASLPSVDRLLRAPAVATLIAVHGRVAVTEAIRGVLGEMRAAGAAPSDEQALLEAIAARLEQAARPTLRPVFNLTGTVLHTNLGRALLPEEAIDAIAEVARAPSTLEFDLGDGRRGERDDHVERLICSLTGAEAATVVNNNAAALLLVLNTLAQKKEVPTSRGELIEIGGSFRLPEIIARAGCRLLEVGTTNRTHLADFAAAIGPKTGAVLKAHTSNYAIAGFTAAVPEAELAALCRERGVPLVVDLGSGALVDLARFGLPHEPTPAEMLGRGADVVTFSGDKLLGGPQAGIIAGRAELIARMRKNPLKRALRVDKLTLAALAALLRLYGDPERVAARIPTLRLLARPVADIRVQAARLQPLVQKPLKESVTLTDCESQVGSGAAPAQLIPSAGLAIRPGGARLAARLRRLPIPVIGRIQEGALILDMRCLEDEAAFIAQLEKL